MEDRECAVVAGVWQGVGVTLATRRLCTSQDFHQVEPGFLDHARQAERVESVSDFATTTVIIVAAVV
jgi:hypothetical protein